MKSILLTGGSGGIGSSIVEVLKNYKVYNLDIQERIPFSNEVFLKTDLRIEQEILNSLQLVELKNLYAIVFCAGFGGPFVTLDKLENAIWEKIFEINVKSNFIILKKVLPYFKENGVGRVIFIASSQSIIGAKNSVAYSSSKHAIIGMMKSIADEWGEYGITSNAISPGYIDTNMGVQEDSVNNHLAVILEKTPSKRIAKPFEVARVVEFLLDEKSNYINGANWAVDGGITAV